MKSSFQLILLWSVFLVITISAQENEIPSGYSNCSCDWTPWMNSDGIDDGVDDETYSSLRSRGYKFCKDPVAIQCANSRTNETVSPEADVVTCNVNLGLKCSVFCDDYKIKVACCYCPPSAIGPAFQIVSEFNDGCLTVTNHTSLAATEIASRCDLSNKAQQWSFVSQSLIKNLLSEQCLAVENSRVVTAQCEANDQKQWWHYDGRAKTLGSGLGYLSSRDGSFVDTPLSSHWMAQVDIGKTDFSTMIGFPCNGEPDPPQNGSVRCSFGSYQKSVCHFSCAPGFALPPSSKYPVTCLPKQEYNGTSPSCMRITCQPPLSTPAHGQLSCTDHSYAESVCQVTCDHDYELTGRDSRIVCGGNGDWSSITPTCKRIECEPQLLDAMVEHGFVNCSNSNFLSSTCSYGCEAGYELDGDATRVCQRDGLWNRDAPGCRKLQCPQLPPLPHGTATCSDGRFYSSLCSFSCNRGYTLVGSGSIVCKSDRLWSGEPPTCERKTCTSLAPPSDGSMTCSDKNFFDSFCSFECEQGFRLTYGNNLTCGTEGWDHGSPQCERIECAHLLVPINGNVTCSDHEFYASRCHFACDRRFVISGSQVVTCGQSGWDFPPPTCRKRTCPPYLDPSNGKAQCFPNRNYEVDSVCVMSCNEGYKLDPPNPQPVECREDGTWEQKKQSCKRIRCRSLTKLKLDDGRVSCSDDNNYKSRCVFRCDDGFNLYGANATLCGAAGWSEQTPTCRRVLCGPQVAQLSNGQVKCTTKGVLSCSYTCNPGFVLLGANQTSCQNDGTWTNSAAPSCQKLECSDGGSALLHGQFDCTDSSLYGSVCNYSCYHGYSLMGQKLVECLETGEWSSSTPTCQRISCPAPASLSNGQITCDEANRFGSTCRFVCDRGYELIGSSTSTCLINKTWDKRSPYCERITCSPGFSNPSNGRVRCSDYSNYGSKCVFTCGKGFHLVGGNTTVCREQKWSLEVAPSCSKITCPVGNPPLSDGTESCARSNELDSVCRYSCIEGFELNGSSARLCQTDGRWSEPRPRCERIECPMLIPAANRQMKCSLQFKFESECVFTCDIGYRRIGPEKIVCTRNKSWKRSEPTRCELIPVSTVPSISTEFNTSSLIFPMTEPFNSSSSPPVILSSTVPGSSAPSEGEVPVMLIAAALSGVVVLVIVVVLVVVIRKRRSKRRPTFKGISLRDRYDEGQAMQKLIPSNGSSNRRFPPILVDRLESEFSRKHADDDKLFREEFASVPDGVGSREQGGKAINKDKNRYTNIIPYDHSRVVLPRVASDDPDYINASFVDGYKHKGKFIAAQGPKDCTINDFWRMIWDQNVSTVIMVTNLVEGEETKCSQYWPQQGSECYGDLSICFVGENHLVDYTVRKFTIQQMNGGATLSMRRNLVHYHFTSWPDFGVPKSPSGMLKFLRKIKQGSPGGYGAIVVHCSAGVGRTGTFICLDAMLDMMTREGKVDVHGFVTQMRAQRPEMVQTEQQYIFIYQALLEHHLYGDTEVEAADVTMHIDELNKRLPGNVTGMEHEFKKLTTIRIQKEQMRAGNHPSNMRKNRVLLILPYDWNRVILPLKPGEENSDYINASYIDGYRQKDAYIATQGPLPHTVHDFWRLIWETKSASVVMLTELVERGQAKCEQYWPDSDVMIYGGLSVEHIGGVKLDYYTTRDFILTSANEHSDRKQFVRQFHYHAWPETGPPVSGYSMIALVEQVQKQQQKSGNHPITIHCSAGAGRTGAFCALSTALEQVKAEGILDMFQIVKCLRMQRPHMVQNLEQYEFCYRAVQEYIDSMSEYYNFK